MENDFSNQKQNGAEFESGQNGKLSVEEEEQRLTHRLREIRANKKIMRKPRILPQVITLEEFNKLLSVVKKPHHRLAFKLGFLCGLRISEIVKLKPEHIDYGRRMIFIQAGKGKKDAFVPLPEPLKKDLKYLPVGIKARAIQTALKGYAKDAGIEKRMYPHLLRHSAATYYLEKGLDIKEVQVLLRHSRLDTTSLYLHISPQKLQNKIDEIWS